MRNQRVTLQDIALLADVTKMTVSRFLRTPEKVSPETRERIAKVMEEVGYPLEDVERPQKTPRIGILVPSFNNQIFSDLLAGIESVTSQQGYQTLVVNEQQELIEELRDEAGAGEDEERLGYASTF